MWTRRKQPGEKGNNAEEKHPQKKRAGEKVTQGEGVREQSHLGGSTVPELHSFQEGKKQARGKSSGKDD